MERARAAAVAALFAILAVSTVALAGVAPSSEAGTAPAGVTWPPATLLVSELQTGGASASDEFVELTNAGAADVDLAGLEVVYVTSTGGTVTRKATWTVPTILGPGRHVLIANGSGAYASVADAVYSGGFAATGGSIVVRAVGGAPTDAVGWGDATNSFVEGAPAVAPAVGRSIERAPGGALGNTTDTNDNGADWFEQVAPNPQNLAAPPVPAPAPSPTILATPSSTPTPATPEPSATPAFSGIPDPSFEPTNAPTSGPSGPPSASPTPSPTATPPPSSSPTPTASTAPTASPTPSAVPTASPAPTPSASPSPSPAPTPTVTPGPVPTPVPTPAPTSTLLPTSTPGPATTSIAEARGFPTGMAASIEGVLTMALPSLESGRAGVIQDATGGIAVYLDATVPAAWPVGDEVRLTGTIDERYGARTIRVRVGDVVELGPADLPVPIAASTGAVGEDLEGVRIRISGSTSGSPTAFADGLGILVDDGSGAVRVILGPSALGPSSVPSGTAVIVVGPVGQRDSTGTDSGGYRINATLAGEFVALPAPSPSPSSVPTPVPTPGPSASPSPLPSPSPSPTPAPTPTPLPAPAPATSIADARSRTVGSVVTVIGVVTAEAGRVGSPPVISIADATAGIGVRLPDGTAQPRRGTLLRVSGVTSDPYGQLEIRPGTGGVVVLGSAPIPNPVAIAGKDLSESTEGTLVVLSGKQVGAARKSTSNDITIDVVDAGGTTVRFEADASSGITSADLRSAATHQFVGIVGQHASKKGALDGYRIWLRDRGDIQPAAVSDTSASPTSMSDGSGTGASGGQDVSIAAASRLDGVAVTVAGVITGGSGFLDSDGRLIVIEDPSGGIEVLLPADVVAPPAGARIRVAGTIGRAYGAPRIHATTVEVVGAHADVTPASLSGLPGQQQEWRLVRIAGTVTKTTRLGDRWWADVRVGGGSVLVSGLAGSGIPSTALVEGRAATIIGIVRRPYPTATDQRWAVTPRGTYDLAIAPPGGETGASGRSTGGATGSKGAGSPTAYGSLAASVTVPDVDLAALAERGGDLVRVGGLVAAITPDGFRLDDGTAIGTVRLEGAAAAFHDLLEVGDAVGLVGRVQAESGTYLVAVADPAGLVRLGDLGEVVPIGALVSPAPASSPVAVTSTAAGLAGPLAGFDGLPGLMSLAMISIASLGFTLARRRQAHRRLVMAAVGRLARLRRPTPPPGAAP